jgi:predicted ATPase/DNA-binding CsgD family transcriptional regulator
MLLLERDAQLGQLDELLAEAGRGRGRVAALIGEAGAGKTSIVEAFAKRAANGARILRSACEDLSIPDPLGPLFDLARGAGLHVPGRVTERLPFFSDALDAFCRASGPTLLVMEDVHWADDATLDLVRFLGRRIRNTRVLLLITARSMGGDGERRFRRSMSDIPADDLVRIEVPLLTEAAITALAAPTGLDAGAIYRATAGNAFFVTELLRAGSDGAPPPGVRDVVLARAERLSAEARKMLEIVSVFPRSADAEAVQRMYGADTSGPLADCMLNGMLETSGSGFAFRHEIARRAIEITLPAPIRRDLNARALAVLRKRNDVPTARLVHHAVEANDAEAVHELAPTAAEEAARLGAHREAAFYYETALRYAAPLSASRRAALLERYAFECHLVGRIGDAIQAARSARDLHRAEADVLKEGDSLRWLSRLSYLFGDRVAADAYGLQALELLERLPPSPELALAHSNLAQLAMLADREADAVRHGETAIALAERFDRPDIVCHALNNVGAAKQWQDPGEGRRLLDRSVAMAVERDLQEHAARGFTNLSCLEIACFRHRAAASVLDAGIAYCVEHDLDTWRDYMRGWLAELLVRRGRWNEAGEVALSVVGNSQAAPLIRFPAVAALARLRIRRGDPAAEPLVAELSGFLKAGMEAPRLASYAVLVAERAWLGQHDVADALCLLERARSAASSPASHGEARFWQRMLAPDVDFGDTAGLAEPHRAFVAGDWSVAASLWREGEALYECALSLLHGDEQAQHEALAILDGLGAMPAAQRARRMLRASGVKRISRGPRGATRANAAGLTRREMDVLRLVGLGFSNKRIAADLCISAKTVDHHVSAVLAKLDAASRGEAVAAARASGLL